MVLLTTALSAILLWSATLLVTLTVAGAQEVYCTAQPPIDAEGNLVIPLNGTARFECESKTNTSRHSWYLDGQIFASKENREIEYFERSNVCCKLIMTEEICDRVIVQITPNTTDLDGNRTRVCTILQVGTAIPPPPDCASEYFTIKIIENSTQALTTPGPTESGIISQPGTFKNPQRDVLRIENNTWQEVQLGIFYNDTTFRHNITIGLSYGIHGSFLDPASDDIDYFRLHEVTFCPAQLLNKQLNEDIECRQLVLFIQGVEEVHQQTIRLTWRNGTIETYPDVPQNYIVDVYDSDVGKETSTTILPSSTQASSTTILPSSTQVNSINPTSTSTSSTITFCYCTASCTLSPTTEPTKPSITDKQISERPTPGPTGDGVIAQPETDPTGSGIILEPGRNETQCICESAPALKIAIWWSAAMDSLQLVTVLLGTLILIVIMTRRGSPIRRNSKVAADDGLPQDLVQRRPPNGQNNEHPQHEGIQPQDNEHPQHEGIQPQNNEHPQHEGIQPQDEPLVPIRDFGGRHGGLLVPNPLFEDDENRH